MLTLALLLKVLKKKVTEKKLQVNYVFCLSKMIALSFFCYCNQIVSLKYSLVQSLVSVVPHKLVSDSAEAQFKFEQLLQILLNGKWCFTEACDKVPIQFKGFVLEMKQNHLAEFLSFNMNADKLDEFY